MRNYHCVDDDELTEYLNESARQESCDRELRLFELLKAQYDFARDACEPVFGYEHDKHREIIDSHGRLKYEDFSKYKFDRLKQVKARHFQDCEPNDLCGQDAVSFDRWLDCQEAALRRAKEKSQPCDTLTKKIAELRAEILRLDPNSAALAEVSAPTRQTRDRLSDIADKLRSDRASIEANIRAAFERKFWCELPAPTRAKLSLNVPASPAKDDLRRELTLQCADSVSVAMRALEKSTNNELSLKFAELWMFRTHRPGGKCPSCGACLVSRTRKNDGVSFVGCGAYPNCTFAWSAMWGSTCDGKFIAEESQVATTKEKQASEEAIARVARVLGSIYTSSSTARIAKDAGFDNSMQFDISPKLNDCETSTEIWRQLLSAALMQGRDDALCRILRADAKSASLSTQAKIDNAWAAWRPLCTSGTAGSKNTSNSEGDAMGQQNASEKDDVKKKDATEKTSLADVFSTVVAMTKDDTEDAAWRTAADEATEIVKPAARRLAQGVTKLSPAFGKFLVGSVDTAIGEGAVAWVTGIAIVGYGPLRGKTLGSKTLRLSKELRVKGIKPLTDVIAKKLIAPVRKELADLIASLPDVIDDLA